MTVLFADLVDSTRIAAALDAEEWRDAVAAYQHMAGAAVKRFDGHIAQFLGDGIVAYFGYPVAHEDDPERALRAALAITEGTTALNDTISLPAGHRLEVRVGVHTGEVVFSDTGAGGRGEPQAFGNTINIAARLQSVAEPCTVIISEHTRRLVPGQFVVRDFGVPHLKGIDERIAAHVVLRPSGVRSRVDIAGNVTPLAGRDLEMAMLVDRWEKAREGRGQIVVLTGEPGIGKSRLVLGLRERLATEPHTWLECRCSHYAVNSPFAPIIEVVQQGLGFTETDSDHDKLAKLVARAGPDGLHAAAAVPVLARFLGVDPAVAPDPGLTPETLRERAIDALVEWGLAMSAHQPVVFLVEDLHWCDPSSLEFLDRLFEQVPAARMFVLLTARPEFELRWPASNHLSPLALSALGARQVRQMLEHLCRDTSLSESDVEAVVVRADGVPLHVEELVAMLRDRASPSGLSLHDTSPIPPTLEGSLMARLDGLARGKDVAQLASVLGREFDYRVMRAMWDGDPRDLDAALQALVRAGLLFVRGSGSNARYLFKHALIQDAAYRSLLKAARRTHHSRAARVLRECIDGIVERRPEILAHHHTEAQEWAAAAEAWLAAGRRAVESSANVEAISYLQKGIEQSARMEDSAARLERELDLLLALGPPLMATHGYADERVERGYRRAREICTALGEPPALLPVMFGLWTYHCLRAHHVPGRALAEQMLVRAEESDDDGLRVEANLALGANLFYLGDLDASATALARSVERYDRAAHAAHAYLYGQDPCVAARSYHAFDLWLLGYPDAARAASSSVVELARTLGHPFSLTYALTFAAWFHSVQGNPRTCLELAEELHRLASERQVAIYRAVGSILIGASIAELGDHADGLAGLVAGLDAYRRTGSEVILPYWQSLLASAHARLGQTDEGLAAVKVGLEASERTGERWADAELLRVRAALLEGRRSHESAVVEAYDSALACAAERGAKGWALRSAIGLSHYLARCGDRAAARARLQDVRATFAASAESEDLRRADHLLEFIA